MPDLAETLGTPLPSDFDQLAEADLARLDAALRAARERRGAELDRAVADSLHHLPGLLRGPVRRVLGL